MARPRGLITKMLQRHERVTVVLMTFKVVKARVRKPRRREIQVVYAWEDPHGRLPATRATYTVRRRDEGITWARGWDGEAPNALRAMTALR